MRDADNIVDCQETVRNAFRTRYVPRAKTWSDGMASWNDHVLILGYQQAIRLSSSLRKHPHDRLRTQPTLSASSVFSGIVHMETPLFWVQWTNLAWRAGE